MFQNRTHESDSADVRRDSAESGQAFHFRMNGVIQMEGGYAGVLNRSWTSALRIFKADDRFVTRMKGLMSWLYRNACDAAPIPVWRVSDMPAS